MLVSPQDSHYFSPTRPGQANRRDTVRVKGNGTSPLRLTITSSSYDTGLPLRTKTGAFFLATVLETHYVLTVLAHVLPSLKPTFANTLTA